MPFNPSPTGYFPGILNLGSGNIVNTSGVFIPYSDLESYSPSTSGDIRQLIYSFNEAVIDSYLELATADRPGQLTMSRSNTIPSDNIVRKTYSITVNLTFGDLSVVSE
jgi:hypothetical protein